LKHGKRVGERCGFHKLQQKVEKKVSISRAFRKRLDFFAHGLQ
jgi:hypothetical protein